ncbi:MAG: flagellar hook assembly protein FlgD [Betaproteobacteria bacterium]|nr:flagellar hook assembly protein FlgD [Betaproteobacteria bacterium]
MAIDTSLIDTLNGGTGAKTTKTSVQDMSDRFMKLLTTQLKNQDPTNPLDNAQMTSQLAQMSTVEGINKLNDSIKTLLDGYKSSQTMQAASLIGRQVLVDGDVIGLNKSLGGGAIELKGTTDKTVVRIFDSNGNEVRTLDMGPQKAGVQAFIWDGLDNGGQKLADGSYTFKVDASKDGKDVGVTSLSLAAVSSVVVNDSGIELQTPELGSRLMSQVRQIY